MSQPLPTPNSTQDQLQALEQLQRIDLQIDELKRKKAQIPVELKKIDQEIAGIQAQISQKEAGIAEIEKTLRQTQAAIDLNSDRMARANGKLEAVSTGQEFQSATKEIEQLKKLNGSLEEQRAKANSDTEGLQQQIEEIRKSLDEKKATRDSQAQALGGQGAEIDSELEKLSSERSQFTPKVDRPLLSRYDRVRGARGGQGIAMAVGGRCKACNMILPPQLFNEVQKLRAVQSCPSCSRILTLPSENKENGRTAEGRPAEVSQS